MNGLIRGLQFFSCLLVLANSLPVMAVGEKDQPIFIESDSLDIDDRKGISTYRGNVHFHQGGSKLWADVVVVYAQDRKDVEKITAEGQPARFEQAATESSELTKGEASLIELHVKESLVVLDGDAQLQQGENQFIGNRIEYESDNKVVRAGKAVAGEGRVQIVIQPNNGSGE